MAHAQISLSALVCVALGAASAPLAAQIVKSDGPKPQFEVATVRPNKSGESGASLGARPGGRLIGTNQTIRNLIRDAFNVQPYQLIGGPDWMDSDRFDIVAKAADENKNKKGMMPYQQFMLRLQALLEDVASNGHALGDARVACLYTGLATEGKLAEIESAHR